MPPEAAVRTEAATPPPAEMDAGLARQGRLGYWAARRHMLYYQAVFQYAAVAGYDAKSVLDVGSAGTDYINWLYWIPERYVLDYSIASPPEGTIAIEADFLAYQPEKRFDLALCCQVLEHVPDPAGFCRKLKEVATNLIVSVPYRWLGNAPGHINDPVDEVKLEGWMGVAPNAWQVVQEPFRERRLIALYNLGEGPHFRYRKDFVLAAIAERVEGA
jgi:SAM-dependent methyltransferase